MRLGLTVERVPRDQLGRDEEGAELLHQLPVGEAAPSPQRVLVQRGDALGHEEAPIGRVAGEEGSLEVDSPDTSPRADVLHGCWGGITVTTGAPEHPPTGDIPTSQADSPQDLPCGWAELLREETTPSQKKAMGSRSSRG